MVLKASLRTRTRTRKRINITILITLPVFAGWGSKPDMIIVNGPHTRKLL